jgi:beta-glucosidase
LNEEPSGSGLVFADIEDSWAKEDIQVLAKRGLITGRSSAAYEPESKITRAEFTVLLVRVLGLQEKVLADGQFADVDPDDWYAGSIAGAVAQNIVCGYKGGIFQPEGSITREEMAVMLGRARYLAGKENELSVAEQEEILARFQDRDKISSWARQEIALAVEARIIEGTAAGKLAPQRELDRAQTAAVLKRFLSYAGVME